MRSVVTLAGLGGLTAGYSIAGILALQFASIHPSISAVWPPTGIAIAGLLLGGYRLWPAILVGAFVANQVTSGHILPSATIAVGNTLEALAAVWLVNRIALGRAVFDGPRSYFAFVLYAAIGSTMISATIGTNTLLWSDTLQWSSFDKAWITWWLGDAVGALLVAPTLVLWATPGVAWTKSRTIEGAILLLGLGAVTWLVFGPLFSGERNLPVTFLPLPLLIWTAFRFTPRETASAMVLVAGVAIGCTTGGTGPFARLPDTDALLLLQMFLGFMGGTSLAVALVAKESRDTAAALVEFGKDLERRIVERTARLVDVNDDLASEIGERTEAQRELADSEARFRGYVEAAPDAIVIVDEAGRIEVVNAQAEQFFGYQRHELIGQAIEILVPERLRERHVAVRAEFMQNPRVRTVGEGIELFGRRKDGSEFPIDISLSPLQTRRGQQVSAAIRDVTRRKRAEQERLANASLRSQVAELSRRTLEIGTLNRMADMLRAAISPEEAYPLVSPFLEEMFPTNCGALYVFNEARTLLEPVARWGAEPPADTAISADSCWALRRGQAHCLLSEVDAGACEHLPSPRPLVSLCIPMTAKAEALGFLHLHRPHPSVPTVTSSDVPQEYTEYKLKLAQAAAEQIAGAIANARLQQKLRAQAIRDPLTGLFNRRSLEESLAHELHRARRRKTKVGLLMLDIDHFKKLNDRFGHGAGDLTLREVAMFLLRVTRKEDIVCRYGGEEILIVLAECSLADLRRRAEQIRLGIKALALEFEGQPLGPVTVSIGASLRSGGDVSADDLIRTADEALYRAKGAGRDRVEVTTPSGDTGRLTSLPRTKPDRSGS